jgi:cytochrome c-type biogenesis protein CcmF
MWYRTSLQRLGRMIAGPAAAATVAIVVLFVALDVRSWVALLGFWIAIFSTVLTILEFVRAAQARMRSKGESVFAALGTLMSRNRRRYGGYIIHLGVLVMAFGIISNELYQQETQIRLNRGESVSLDRYEMIFNGIRRYPGADDLVNTEATVDVYKDGRFVTTLSPRTELYTRTQQPMTIPDVRSTFLEDFYVILVNWEGTSDSAATFRLFVNPLINWVWAGALVFVAGTLVAAWPSTAEQRIIAASREPGLALGGAVGD